VLRTSGPKKKWWETGEDCIMESFVTCTLHYILSDDQVQEDEMGGSCSTHRRDEKCVQYFVWKDVTGRDHLEDKVVDCRIIL
jgi:hypothetical protein